MNVSEYAPGSPQGIAAIANRIGETGTRAADAKGELQSISSNCSDIDWEGTGQVAYVEYIRDLPAELGRMFSSYSSVASALKSFSYELEDVQTKVRQALARYELAQARKAQAEGEVSRAGARLKQLQSQLVSARAQEQTAKVTVGAATFVPGSDAGAYQQYIQARDRRARLETDTNATARTKNRHQAVFDSARQEMTTEIHRLEAYREQYQNAEGICAQRVHDALDADLRNRSWFEKNILDPIGKVLTSEGFQDFVFALRQALEKFEVFFMVASLALAFTPFGPLFMAINLVLNSVKLATGVYLAANRYRDPSTGELAVGGGDILGDFLGVAFSAFQLKAFALAKGNGKWVGDPLLHKGPLKLLTKGAAHIIDGDELGYAFTRAISWAGNYLIDGFREDKKTVRGKCFAQ